jgi:hypothetical protein
MRAGRRRKVCEQAEVMANGTSLVVSEEWVISVLFMVRGMACAKPAASPSNFFWTVIYI